VTQSASFYDQFQQNSLHDLSLLSPRDDNSAALHSDLESSMTKARSAPRADWLLLTLFVGLQVADIASTNYALAIPGVHEVNPLMALSQSKLGAIWWLPKLAVVGVLSAMAFSIRRRWPIVFAISASGLAVLVNLAHH
jgi:hypothetical protein